MIHLKSIYKSFLSKNHSQSFSALSNINLSINSGEIFGIVGKSGSGKTTLLKMINFMEKPTHGQIFIDDVELGQLNQKKLRQVRKQIGVVFQGYHLLHSQTVFENIALPLRTMDYTKKQINFLVEEVLQEVDLLTKKDLFPGELSGGQKQRIAIARAIVTKPKILLCDEPTSALDEQTANSILKLIQFINQKYKVTVALITHDLSVVKLICHRVAEIENGQLTGVSHVC